jgi:hypothetical protein
MQNKDKYKYIIDVFGTSALRPSSMIFVGSSDGHALLEIRSSVE